MVTEDLRNEHSIMLAKENSLDFILTPIPETTNDEEVIKTI
jgi:hypothetical protein